MKRLLGFATAIVVVALPLILVITSVWELTTRSQQIAFGLLEAFLVLLALVVALRAMNAFPNGYWKWVESHPGSLPFGGWVVVAAPLLVGAFLAPDSSTRTAFALSFGACALVMGTVAALGWARSQYVVTEELLQVLTWVKGYLQTMKPGAPAEAEQEHAAGAGTTRGETSHVAGAGADLKDERPGNA